MISAQAAFDCLSITDRLERIVRGTTHVELHLFAYLGCLLSLYRGRMVADWSYGFAGTKNGSPYSREVEDAFRQMASTGWFVERDGLHRLSDGGRSELNELREISQNTDRDQFLAGACSTVLTMPIGQVRAALAREPDLKAASIAESARPLLDETSCELLHDQFSSLSKAVGVEVADLLIPAVVWLTCLVLEASPAQGTAA